MYRFKTQKGDAIGGTCGTREGALGMALHMANKRDEPITVLGGPEPIVVHPVSEDR